MLLVVGAIVAGSGPEEKREAPHELALPTKLVDKYQLHSSSDAAPRGDGAWDPVDVKDWTGVAGKYAVAIDRPNVNGVVIAGMYGDIAHPERVRESLLRGTADRDDTKLAVRPEEFVIDADGPEWSCQVVVRGKGLSKTTLPVCAWADESTAGSVLFLSPRYMTEPPARVDLDHAARDAHAIRDELRKPVE
ncbi:hypothetical protein QIS99_19175 [Streptomyces sp. B-S-A8]|uniref:Uncharacterized protein n=1 Tax=Streptomyces solicavernae TaxID=3043614 RepID=A0ABT6RV42_9ACTN|nr:hypothetical protein [Streptomyces sp. B-S-A8]MDI3388309.1 hypothetical protein [Streptomyces sp. B-S-A8]